MPGRTSATSGCRGRDVGLTFIAGYVDTAVFVGLFGLFTAHVTGNLVLIGSELVHRRPDVWPKLLAFPAFIVAVAAAVKIGEKLERWRTAVAPMLLYTEAALLLLAFGAVVLRHPARSTDPAAVIAGVLATGAMGIQNAMMRTELASVPSTTVMTVNVTQTVVDLVTMISRNVDPATDGARRQESRTRFARMWPHVVGFIVGAAAGAAGYALAGFAALLVPSGLCVALAARWKTR